MRNLIFFMHTSLDGFVAGLKGELDWAKIDDEMFDFVATMTDTADTALYGRVTYEMMQSYWPKAGEQPNATKHDKEHSAWYNKVSKIVLSKTISEKGLDNTTVISGQLADNINKIKNVRSLSRRIHNSSQQQPKIEMDLFILYNLQLEIINFLYKNLRKAECCLQA